jgi:hypothetical protein
MFLEPEMLREIDGAFLGFVHFGIELEVFQRGREGSRDPSA